MKKLHKTALALAVGLSMPTFAVAQNTLTLEEVIVTAQKREQNLQDVPVSVNVVSGEDITEVGIQDLEEMSTYVPNFSVIEGSQSTIITMRGLGSGVNQGFEQSVGMFIDGIYAGRHRQFRSPFMDVQNVEVLRGPQGTLFGKNTIAGALNISTAKPTDEFEASIRAGYETETKRGNVEAIISGPLSDTVKARLALKGLESDGHMKNTMQGNSDQPQVKEQLARLTLVFDPTENLSISTKLEAGKYDTKGSTIRVDDLGGWEPVYKAADPNFNNADFYSASTNVAEFSDNENKSVTVNVDYDMNGYTLTSITGYSDYEFDDMQDVDFSPIEMLDQRMTQKFDQISQEFRITSPISDTFDFLGGVYYQKSNLDHTTHVNANLGAAVGGVPADALAWFNVAQAPVTVPDYNTASITNALDPALLLFPGFQFPGEDPVTAITPANAAGAILAAATLDNPATEDVGRGGRFTNFYQKAETAAIYAQGTWHAREDLHLTLGLRYSEEKKDASRSLYLTNYGTNEKMPFDDSTAGMIALWQGVFGTSPHSVADGGKTKNTSPSIKIQYDINEDIMAYASASKAFKSGGFSESGTNNDNPNDFGFDQEKALAFEIGSKMSIMGGRGTLNVALFRTEYKDLQVSAFVGDRYVVGNAASATSQGLELDGVFRLTESIDITASFAYLDATYDKFPDASCTIAQVADATAAGGLQAGRMCTQDLAGKPLPNAPEYTGNLGLYHNASFNNGMALRSNVFVNYTDEQYLQQNLDPSALEKAHTTINARIGLAGVDDKWEVALVGKNLTDEKIRSYSAGIPILTGSTFSMSALPRTVAVQLTARY